MADTPEEMAKKFRPLPTYFNHKGDEISEDEIVQWGNKPMKSLIGPTGAMGPAGRDFEWNIENQERVNEMVDYAIGRYVKPNAKKLPGPLANLDPEKVAAAVAAKKVSDVTAEAMSMHDLIMRLQVLELQVDELRRDNDKLKQQVAEHDDRINWLET